MLPEINLDDLTYAEIVQRAVKNIPSLTNEWTNFNESDPGITLLELFAFFTEIQQFHLNQTSEKIYFEFLKLLNITPLKKKCAKGLIATTVKKETVLPKKSRFFSDTICFEVVDTAFLVPEKIESLFGVDEYYKYQSHTNTRVYLFGNSGENDNFSIKFSGIIPENKIISLYFSFHHANKFRRNYVSKNFIPLVNFELYSEISNEYFKAEIISDDTFGFIKSGIIKFRLKKSSDIICFKICDGEFDIPPVLNRIYINTVEVVQRKTLCEYIDTIATADNPTVIAEIYLALNGNIQAYKKTGENCFEKLKTSDFTVYKRDCEVELKFDTYGDIRIVFYDYDFRDFLCYENAIGLSDLKIHLKNKNIIGDNFSIMVENNGVYNEWHLTENLNLSEFDSYHFEFDAEKGIISFGDGDFGKAPCGNIIIVSATETLGKNGNIHSRTLNFQDENISVFNPYQIVGGQNCNTDISEIQSEYLKQEKNMPKTLVTKQDYEQAVMNTPGLIIEDCCVVETSELSNYTDLYEENSVTIIVKSSKKEHLPQRYCENIMNFLESRRMIGTSLNIIPPVYVGISVYCTVVTSDTNTAAVKNKIYKIIKKHFESEQKFGAVVSQPEIENIIGKLKFVLLTEKVSVSAKDADYIIKLPANALAYAEKIKVDVVHL
ncbi:MAG: baseplate J/gp47 family protein [Oscillospiraceae bacterium]|jgi:hypothetical protein|nr:baseplate J/gp47 family protein [Oscillospiraceae bacterium]